MNLVIRGKNIEVPPIAKDYIAKKVNRFEHHLKNITEIKVELSQEKRTPGNHYVVEMTLDCQGTLIRGEKRGPDVLAAIDAAVEAIDRQVTRYKDRLETRRQRGTTKEKGAEASGAQSLSQAQGNLIKTKRFKLLPMTPEEAIDQMELLEHDFFVFFNAFNKEINVVYRRQDGAYGLIEPVVD